MIAQRIGLDNLHRLKLLEPCLLCYLVLALVSVVLQMADVGDIPHIAHLVAEMPQKLLQDIIRNSRTCMPEMGVAIYGRSADIHSDTAFIYRYELFFLSGKGIC